MANSARLVPLSALDRAFLWLDRRIQPFHVAFLSLLTPPPGAGDAFVEQLADRLRAAVPPTPPFNRRLVWHRGVQTWLEDDSYDPEQHIVSITLPAPGRIEQVQALAARLHGVHLDRAFPLWRVYLVGGLADGRIALYCKLHHALADGMSAMRLLLRSMSADPLASLPPPWAPALEPRAPRGAPSIRSRVRHPFRRSHRHGWWLRGAVQSVPAVWSELRLAAREAEAGDDEAVRGDEAPACILNQKISSTRQFASRSIALSRVKAIGRTLGATTNDVVLALCGAALRSFLIEVRALPDAPLVAMVPMSVREPGDPEEGNRIVPLLVRLGTDVPDPLQRLRVIRRSAERSKARCRALGMGESYACLLATSGTSALRLLFQPSAGRLPFNVIISNVTGPTGAMYWQGCRVDSLHPLSIVVDGLALNITFTSRGDWLDFGLVACRRSLPPVGRILDHLEHALAELETFVPRPETVPLGDGLHEIRVPRRHARRVRPRKSAIRPPVDPAAMAPAANDSRPDPQAEQPAG